VWNLYTVLEAMSYFCNILHGVRGVFMHFLNSTATDSMLDLYLCAYQVCSVV